MLNQVKEIENKLAILRGGVTLVKPEDRKAIEEIYSEKVSQWRKRRRMFKDIWDPIMENSPKNLNEFKVSIGSCVLYALLFGLAELVYSN